MLREGLKKHSIGRNKEFRYRGEEPGRLENFSDAVFALAITLPRGNWMAGMISGFTYFLYTPVMMIHGRRVDRQRKKLIEVGSSPSGAEITSI